MIVPDLPPEEAASSTQELRAAGLALIPLLAPTTPAPRRARICAAAQGFVYLVSDTRTTGERDELPSTLAGLIEAARADSPVPVAVGFGIGTAEQAAEVGRLADGVIIGSRLVRAVAESADSSAAAAAVGVIHRCLPRADVRAGHVGWRRMRLLVFTVVGLIALVIAYAFSLGGTVAALIFLFIIFNGILDRWAKPLIDWVRA